MRFSSSVLLALPLLAVAAESPFEQYKAQFQNFLSNLGAKAPSASKEEKKPETTTTQAAVGSKTIETLTLENWNETLFKPVQPDATKPEEWWVLVTGRNKTCFGQFMPDHTVTYLHWMIANTESATGHCLKVESAFNESALKFAVTPNTPHLASVNCDDEPILCNSWSASTGTLWIFEMLPRPAPIEIYRKRLNLTTTTSQTFLDLHAAESKEGFKLHDGWFHPYDGPLAQNNLAIPAGYFFYYFNMVPSWAFMLIVSFVSRTFM
jgi:hypothetical protein